MSDQRPLHAPPTLEAASSEPDISIEEGPVVHEPPRAVPEAVAPPRPLGSDTQPISSSGGKKRRPMLKIPDDEISRPQTTPSAPPVSAPAMASPPSHSSPSHSSPSHSSPSYSSPAVAPVPSPSAPTPVRSPSQSAPSYPRPSSQSDETPITAMRIISIDAPPVVTKSVPVPRPVSVAPAAAPSAPAPPPPVSQPAPGSSTAHEDSWTPYQPVVTDRTPAPVAPMRARMPSQPPLPLQVPVEREAGVPPAPATVPQDPPTIPRAFFPVGDSMASLDASAPRVEQKSSDSMDEIPIVTEALAESPDSAEPLDVEAEGVVVKTAPKPVPPAHPSAPSPPLVASHPPASGAGAAPASVSRPPIAPTPPVAPAISVKDLPPMRAMAPTEPEGLEVRFDDEDPMLTPQRPRALTEAPEIAPEDLVSVESAPAPMVGPLGTPTPGRAFIPPGAAPAPPVGMSSSMGTATATAAATTTARTSVPPAKGTGAQRVYAPVSSSPLAPPPMTDTSSTRRKARPWWEELFNDDFIRTMAKITDAQVAGECTFIEDSLGVVKGGMVLDLACGTGRHAIELTRRGYKVVGFDLSLPMLARAAEEAQERNQKLNFVQGDMREMTFEDTFDGVYCWATSFGFFEEEKNAAVVQRVHKALKKGGQFLLDVINRDYLIRQGPSLAWFEGDGCVCMDEMSIDWITSRMKVKRTMMMDDGRTKEIDYSVRVYSLHELGKILHDSGFRVAEVSGRASTPGVFFGNESPRTLILAEKR